MNIDDCLDLILYVCMNNVDIYIYIYLKNFDVYNFSVGN